MGFPRDTVFIHMKRRQPYLSSRDLASLREERQRTQLSEEQLNLLRDFKRYRIRPTVEHMVEALGSGFFDNLTLDAMHKRLIKGYSKIPTAWQLISNRRPRFDFRLNRAMANSGIKDLEVVREGGTYNEVLRTDEDRGSYVLVKHGGIFSLTMEADANDELNGLNDAVEAFGVSASRTLDKYVIGTNLNDNPTIYDSVALVGTTHKNWGGLGELTDTMLAKTLELMWDQGGVGSDDEMEAEPAVLLVNTQEYLTAKRIIESSTIDPSVFGVGIPGEKNVLQDIVRPVKSRRITKGRRFLVADPAMADMFELGFWQGNEDPESFVEQAGAPAEFETDSRRTKARHIYAGAWRDYRGIAGWGMADGG